MPTTRNFAKDVLHILSVTTTTDYLHQSGNIKDKVDGQLDIPIVYHNLGTEIQTFDFKTLYSNSNLG